MSNEYPNETANTLEKKNFSGALGSLFTSARLFVTQLVAATIYLGVQHPEHP